MSSGIRITNNENKWIEEYQHAAAAPPLPYQGGHALCKVDFWENVVNIS